MKANRKYIEDEEAVSAVIGVILMVAITVAIAATVYVYVSGLATAPSSGAENASVAVKNENGKIKITLTKSGNNMPDSGYSFSNSVTVRVNGTAMLETGLTATDWAIGGSLYVGYTAPNPVIDDTASDVGPLPANTYSVTVIISETVIFDGAVRVI